MKRYGIIMAGGSGTRLWPLSRRNHPKQITKNLFGDESLLDKTLTRISPLFEEDRLIISAGMDHKIQLQDFLAGRKEKVSLLYQPSNRNNAPFTLYMALKIVHEQGDGLMALFPSDHLVADDTLFHEEMSAAMEEAEVTGRILCLGTDPRYASTRFGYLRIDPTSERDIVPVKEFKEKPDYLLASEYLADGRYLWNSGIYLFSAKTAIASFERYLPRIYHAMLPLVPYLSTDQEEERLAECYKEMPDISLDYGIMEHTEDLYVYRSQMEWTDVGTYKALEGILVLDEQNNHIRSPFVGIECKNNLVFSDHQTVAAIGLTDSVVVVRDDVIFIAQKDRVGEIRILIELMKEQGYEHLL